MTLERAMEILDPNHREHYNRIEPVNEACEIGRKAIEKQIAKQPKKEKLFDDFDLVIGSNYYCLVCNKYITSDFFAAPIHYEYCCHCGQKLDWSDGR